MLVKRHNGRIVGSLGLGEWLLLHLSLSLLWLLPEQLLPVRLLHICLLSIHVRLGRLHCLRLGNLLLGHLRLTKRILAHLRTVGPAAVTVGRYIGAGIGEEWVRSSFLSQWCRALKHGSLKHRRALVRRLELLRNLTQARRGNSSW